MKHVVASMLVAFAIAGVALSPFAFAVSVTEGSDASGMAGTPMLDKTTKRVKCEQATRGPSVTLPGSSAHAWNACASVTTTYADYCGNVANGIPCLDSATKISRAVVPDLGSSYANTYLSNLAASTAINQPLIPAADATIDLGYGDTLPLIRWKDLYLSGNVFANGGLFADSYVAGSNIDLYGDTTGHARQDLYATTLIAATGGDYAFAYRTGTNTVTNTGTGTGTSCQLDHACSMVRTSTTTATATVTNSVNGIAISSNPVLNYSSVGAPPDSRAISTSNGLQGGGNLGADRTLSPVYGSSANTVAQGNDTRIVNAVQTPRTVCGHALSSDVTCTAGDVGAVSATSVHEIYQQNAMLGTDVVNSTTAWVAVLSVTLSGHAATGDTINCWASASGYIAGTARAKVRIHQVNNGADGVTKAYTADVINNTVNLAGVYSTKLVNSPTTLLMYLDYTTDGGSFIINGSSSTDHSATLLCQVVANVP